MKYNRCGSNGIRFFLRRNDEANEHQMYHSGERNWFSFRNCVTFRCWAVLCAGFIQCAMKVLMFKLPSLDFIDSNSRSHNFSRTEFPENYLWLLFFSSSSSLRSSSMRKFNFSSTVSLNKFDAVIELNWNYEFLRFFHIFYAVLFLLSCSHSLHAIDWHTLFSAVVAAVGTANSRALLALNILRRLSFRLSFSELLLLVVR